VYGEWAPLASVARSGILDACGHFLSSAEFRAPACEVLRHVASRRRGDAVNDAIRARREGDGGGGEAASGVSLDAAQAEAASDAEAVVNGFAGMCRSLGVAASRVLAAPAADPGSDELEYVVRLTETIATLATNHGSTLEDRGLRAAFLEALLGLTVYPSLDVLGAAVQAWPALLRGSGAELPGTFVKPEKAAQSGVWGAAQQRKHQEAQQRGEQQHRAPSGSHALPDGAVAALLDASSVWLQRGGGLATGLATRHAPGSSADEWEENAGFESREELREAWVGLRARLMEVTKLCAALDPAAAAAKARDRVDATLRATAPGGPLEAAKVNAEFAASAGANAGRAALDDGLGAALEGATAFAESVIQALPLPVGEDGFGGGFGSGGAEGSGRGGLAAAEAFAPALEAMLTNALAAATSVRTPVSVSQMSRLLEALGRVALVRPDAGPAIMRRLFEMLAALPADDVQAPPARAKAAVAAGRTAQAARQRVCAAVLGVCAAAPKVREGDSDPRGGFGPDGRFPGPSAGFFFFFFFWGRRRAASRRGV
jgi:exportin-5